MNLYSIFLKNLQIEKKIITENREYSYRQIFNFVENTSSIIKKYKHNKKILLVSNNFFSYLILFYVCSKLGKTLIPVNSSLSKNQILSIYKFIKPDIVAFSNEYSFFKRYIKSDKLIPDINFYQETDKKLTNITNRAKLSKKYMNNDYIVTFSSGTTSLPKPILYTQKIKYNRYLHIKNLYKIKHSMKDELSTKDMIDRYRSIFVFCKIYASWALLKKDEQIHDITKKERFDVTPDLPLKITTTD